MLKILSANQIRQLDACTIQQEPVASFDLMERACRAFVHWFTSKVDGSKKTGIVCGTGNNGGDGLGIARLLRESGYNVKVWIVRGGIPESQDFSLNLKKLEGKTEISEITSGVDKGLFAGRDVLIDAIFGSGLSRPVEGIYAEAISSFNASDALKIAVDIPSGMMADVLSRGAIVRARHTATFQLPKLAFFLPQSHPYTGEWTILDIGLDKSFIREAPTDYFYFLEKDACKLLRKRSRFDHKGTFGHCLLIAGSYGKMGAAVLAGRAAMRSGSGLLTIHAPASANPVLQTSVPEAMFSPDENENCFSVAPSANNFTTIGIGPGLGQDKKTVSALRSVLENFKSPVVLDADALNIIGAHRDMMPLIPEGSILTPHAKEFERLTAQWNNDFERLQMQRELSAELTCIVILKGAYSSIATPDKKIYFNSTGNPGMATGGTGDVLTGMLTGLLAQKYSPKDAALLGVFLHGLAGDIAAFEKGQDSLIASDLVDSIPNAFKMLNRS